MIVFAQRKLIKQTGGVAQSHLERLRAEIGRYPRMEDLLFMHCFKIEINPEKVVKTELGVKIDPRVHNIYSSKSFFLFFF